jgi:hypothetical protein
MIKIQIIGIRKPGDTANHHSAISHYKWQDQNGQTGIWDRMAMVNWIQQDPDNHKAYVTDRARDVVYCRVVRNQYGTWFLETRPDGILADNLLRLPPC